MRLDELFLPPVLPLMEKQVGTIYHFTDMWAAYAIIDEGKLKPKGAGGFSFNGGAFVIDRARDWVSFTRNPNLKVTPATGARSRAGEAWSEVRIEFDGDRIAHRHKVEPYHDDDGRLTRQDNQAEERVVGEVNVKGAIKGVTFFYDVYLRNKTDWDTWCARPEGEQCMRYTKQAREEAAWMIREIKRRGIPVKIVRGLPKRSSLTPKL